jgi:tetratricopeptide (TPR) repeat protein
MRQKIEGLPDDHHYKSECSFNLSQLFYSAGNYAEQKRILVRLLKLKREQGDDLRVARALTYSSYANRMLGLRVEGIQEAKEALEIYERCGDTARQAECLISLAWLLVNGGLLDAAEEAASRAINIVLVGKGEDFLVCRSHRVLGDIYSSKGKREKAVHHYEVSLGIASPFNWHNELFWIHYCLAKLFLNQKKFNDAHAHIEQAKMHAVEDAYCLGRAMEIRAGIWYVQYRFGDAASDALRALEIYEKLGAAEDARNCRASIPAIRKEKIFWSIYREFSSGGAIS